MIQMIMMFILQQITPNIYSSYAGFVLRIKINEMKDKRFIVDSEEIENADQYENILKQFIEKERDRKIAIEDKAKASLFVITISISLLLSTLGFIKQYENTINELIIALLILGIIYLVLSGFSALKAINIKEFYDIYLNDKIDYKDCHIQLKNIDLYENISNLYKFNILNQLITNQRSNYVYATFTGIRNGMLLIALCFVCIVGNVAFNGSKQQNNNIQIDKKEPARDMSIEKGNNINVESTINLPSTIKEYRIEWATETLQNKEK